MTTVQDVKRCELTELPADQCGCRRHRGGLTPEEQVAAERAAWVHRVFIARLSGGCCEVCEEPIRKGQSITSVRAYGHAHYRHVDCEEGE